MPEPYGYWRVRQGGEVLVGFGRRVMFHFDERDMGMRNLTVVALTEAGAKGTEVAALFELSPVYVARSGELSGQNGRAERTMPGIVQLSIL